LPKRIRTRENGFGMMSRSQVLSTHAFSTAMWNIVKGTPEDRASATGPGFTS
jgi:hypothetical protein